jgi:DNA-binding winged helix-turn-helix (wHTH) protein
MPTTLIDVQNSHGLPWKLNDSVNDATDGIDHRSETVLRFEDITLEKDTGRVWRGERLLSLAPGSYRLLSLLIDHPGRVFTREEIREAIGGYKIRSPRSRAVDLQVSYLRLALGQPEMIWTIDRIGYGLGRSVLHLPVAEGSAGKRRVRSAALREPIRENHMRRTTLRRSPRPR